MLLPYLNVPAVQDGCWTLVKGQQQEGGGVKKVHAPSYKNVPTSLITKATSSKQN